MTDTGSPCERSIAEIYRMLEATISVRRRYQFFLWTQGELQQLLPHDFLLSAAGNLARFEPRLDCFSSREMPPDTLRRIETSPSGFLPRLVAAWLERDYSPLLLSSDGAGESDSLALAAELALLGFAGCAAHGVADSDTGHGSFFIFLNAVHGASARHRRCLEMLVPHMHMALQRIQFSEKAGGEQGGGDNALSDREAEIFKWMRAGKTNQEIGQILNISPFTVKNHVQKILRKLNVANRTQAAAKTPPMRGTEAGASHQ